MAVEKVDNMVVTPDSHTVGKHTDVTRYKFLPAVAGHILAGTPTSDVHYAVVEGGANLDEPIIYFNMDVPDDFVSFTSITAIWHCGAAAGNMYWLLQANYCSCSEAFNTHADAPAVGATATGGLGIKNCQTPANPLTLAGLVVADSIGIYFGRNGSDALDTLNDVVKLHGLRFTYVGHQ